MPVWFYLVSPWIGLVLTLLVIGKLIQIDVFPGAARIKAFIRPTLTPPTQAELDAEAQVIAQLKATGYRINEEIGDDDRPLPLPRRIVHPITVVERQSEVMRATVKRIRVQRDGSEVGVMARTYTHYITPFTARNAEGHEQAACGQFVPASLVAPAETAPTCPFCLVYVEGIEESTGDGPIYDDRADHLIPSSRRLSRYEQLEALADSGCDTYEEYRGER